MIEIFGLAGLFLAAVVAGAINSVAGGGTLISFPSLVAFGEPDIISNATNTAALWPGSLSSAVGYRKFTHVNRTLLTLLIVPSFIGGLLGAVVLVVTPESLFQLVVPCLILFATILFAARNFISRKLAMKTTEETVTRSGRIWGFFFQLFVAAYGGYFGAGIGILMLGSLSVMGLRDVHVMKRDENNSCGHNQRNGFHLLCLEGVGSLAARPPHGCGCDNRRVCGRTFSETR